VLERFERLRRRLKLGPIALTESANVRTPLVVFAREVCLPCGLRDALPAAELDAVLAHELAHLQRGDAYWFPLVSLLCSLFWMQPINRDPGALACALLHVAEGSLRGTRQTFAPTMRGTARVLVLRIERLSLPRPVAAESQRLRPWTAASLGLAALGLACLNVRPSGRHFSSSVVPDLPAPLDPVRESARMGALLQREHELAEQLEIASNQALVEGEGSAQSVRVLELRQELAHVRATESWIEQRFR
jgi:hypothetical protein